MARKKKTSAQIGGQMPLMEHVRELRSRIIRALLGITLGVVLAWYFYPEILAWLTAPYEEVRPALEKAGINTELVMMGIGGGFQFRLKLSLIAGLIFASPIWLWQLWAFVVPALFKHERRIALGLTALCVPLFVGGAWLGYWVFPKAIHLLIGFVPMDWGSLLSGADYLTFAMRMMILFGIGAQLPVIVVVLNRLGIVRSAQLVHARPWIVVGIFVFAALATPTVDPVTFLFLGIPMTLMHLVAERIAVFTERKRTNRPKGEGIDDDQASRIDSPEAI